MENLSIEIAEKFLDEHFRLFIEKQREAGFNCQIILDDPPEKLNSKQIFYVRFRKDEECSKCYKIIY